MKATKAIAKSYNPLKINHASYGNIVPHIHWHIIPRFETEINPKSDPWSNANMFNQYKTDLQMANEVINKISSYL